MLRLLIFVHGTQEMQQREDPVLRMELARHAKQVSMGSWNADVEENLCKV